MNLCINCKYYDCGLCIKNQQLSLVDNLPNEFKSAQDERTWGWVFCRLFSQCGKEGRFFEANE